MDFLLRRGHDFTETFDFKTDQGEPVPLPRARYRVVVQRGTFVREYAEFTGLQFTKSSVVWKITARETADFAYNTLYYTLFMNETELARGVLKVQ